MLLISAELVTRITYTFLPAFARELPYQLVKHGFALLVLQNEHTHKAETHTHAHIYTQIQASVSATVNSDIHA